MSPPHTNPSVTKYQRITLGVIGAALLSIGGAMYFAAPAANLIISALLIRVGMLLCVIWLAFDQILHLSKYFSALVIAVGLSVLVLIAARPNLSKIVLVLCAVLAAFSFFTKFIRPKP